jgi:metal-responsive CopG/Arc/MetJ family transcriptional regulator
MASRKMTFSIPEKLAVELTKRVPARGRSSYVAKALVEKLRERDRLLVRAAAIANRSRAARQVEKEMDAITDELMEPWDDAKAR